MSGASSWECGFLGLTVRITRTSLSGVPDGQTPWEAATRTGTGPGPASRFPRTCLLSEALRIPFPVRPHFKTDSGIHAPRIPGMRTVRKRGNSWGEIGGRVRTAPGTRVPGARTAPATLW
ncbi:hypothetical protein GCM10010297_18250 [Streptomyces malachitofuscus]|nr:hypothetical protein GCM10010297_18250 [Streptomyces malachitofuscus]